MPTATVYRCTNDHDFYSHAPRPVETCPFPSCNGEVVAVKGPWKRKAQAGA